ncbi:MAG: T9SS type A sorting domain-containing protein [Chitinophagaceae bacterium]|nr:T9SS type A sorting domain-containing protein [Chitinophagaceae bacterium]MBL0055064.1 T9SS type A sorting domain-containing protein [Chitinophagaceae bacterium]
MKYTLNLLLILACMQLSAQTDGDRCKSVNEIALMEQLAHQRLDGQGVDGTNGTLASNNFDVKYYRCDWEVNPAVRFIKGSVTIYFVMTAGSANIQLDLMNPLVVDSVKQRNVLLAKSHVSNVLTVNFPGTINTGTLDSITVYYQGVPPNTGFGSFVLSSHAGVASMWSLSEPYGARDWWPCKNGLDDKADSLDIIVTCPAAYRGAGNGLLQYDNLIAAGTKRQAYWKHRYPIASYLIAFAVTNFSVFNNNVQLGAINMPVQTYCYPESQVSFQNGTQNVLDALKQFHDLFGDYPFIKEKYGHVQFGWGGGMEHQTASYIVSIDEGLIVHELAHQWFGDKVTCGSWADIWLNEGFASHLTNIYMEKKYPASIINNRKSEINQITSSAGGSVWVEDTASVGRIFDGRLSYTKGSHLVYMLRWKLGDSIFFKGMRNYLVDPKLSYGYALTDDLRRHLEAVSGQSLTEFFNDWFKGQGYPSYNVQWSQMGSSYVKIKMSQVTSHASVSFFEMPVALKFKNATQEKTIVVDNKTNGETFIRNIGFVADTVLIDPEYWLITKNNTSAKVPDANNGQNSVLVYPNPIGPRFNIYLSGVNAPTADIILYNSLGQRVYTRNVTLVNGSEFLEIPSAHLSSGIYTLRVLAGKDLKYVKKLLK